MANLGHILAHTTIANILKRYGIEPAPERVRKTTWKEFLEQHWDQILASDFFTIEVWTASGLTRFIVLFFIDLSTRRAEIGDIRWECPDALKDRTPFGLAGSSYGNDPRRFDLTGLLKHLQ